MGALTRCRGAQASPGLGRRRASAGRQSLPRRSPSARPRCMLRSSMPRLCMGASRWGALRASTCLSSGATHLGSRLCGCPGAWRASWQRSRTACSASRACWPSPRAAAPWRCVSTRRPRVVCASPSSLWPGAACTCALPHRGRVAAMHPTAALPAAATPKPCAPPTALPAAVAQGPLAVHPTAALPAAVAQQSPPVQVVAEVPPGTRHGSASLLSSIEFNRTGACFATAGVSKRISVFQCAPPPCWPTSCSPCAVPAQCQSVHCRVHHRRAPARSCPGTLLLLLPPVMPACSRAALQPVQSGPCACTGWLAMRAVCRYSDVVASAQRPAQELVTRSKLASLAWHQAQAAHLISSDYEGIITLWDTQVGEQGPGRRWWGAIPDSVPAWPAHHQPALPGGALGAVVVPVGVLVQLARPPGASRPSNNVCGLRRADSPSPLRRGAPR